MKQKTDRIDIIVYDVVQESPAPVPVHPILVGLSLIRIANFNTSVFNTNAAQDPKSLAVASLTLEIP